MRFGTAAPAAAHCRRPEIIRCSDQEIVVFEFDHELLGEAAHSCHPAIHNLGHGRFHGAQQKRTQNAEIEQAMHL